MNARPARGYLVSRETPNLTERTTQILREAILQLRLKPGERLVERDLAGQTGASRTCVRAAMQQLRTEGLVERSSGGMLSVASISPDEARQIYEVRAALESAMARLFAARATEEEQAALKYSHEWIEFEGTLFCQPLMGGYANVDDTVFEVPGGTYRGVAPRSFDAKTGQWSIWWMDGSDLSLVRSIRR